MSHAHSQSAGGARHDFFPFFKSFPGTTYVFSNFIHVVWLISYIWDITLACETWLKMHRFAFHKYVIVTWIIHMWHDPFTCKYKPSRKNQNGRVRGGGERKKTVTWLIQLWHDWFTCKHNTMRSSRPTKKKQTHTHSLSPSLYLCLSLSFSSFDFSPMHTHSLNLFSFSLFCSVFLSMSLSLSLSL